VVTTQAIYERVSPLAKSAKSLLGLAHLDSAQRGNPAGQIEQDFIGAGPTNLEKKRR
jgi:hypothetical protein